MKTIPDSGILYPNLFIRNLLLSVEDVAGVNGVKTVLNMAGQSEWIDNYPPANMEGGIDFARYSMIVAALDDLYGDKGGKIFGQRAGEAMFTIAQKAMGSIPGFALADIQSKSAAEKAEFALCMVRTAITRVQTTTIPRTDDGQFLYAVKQCPVCYGRTTTTPRCFITVGLLKAAIRWATGGQDFDVKQVRAQSCGDPTCDYVIPLEPTA